MINKKLLSLIKKIKLIKISENNGSLVPLEFQKDLKLNIKRVFQVYSGFGNIRGKHAHKKSTQILLCNYGKIEVTCFFGKKKKTFLLYKNNELLLIPPKIWCVLKFINNRSILTVFSNTGYLEDDYIRDYNEYLEYLANKL